MYKLAKYFAWMLFALISMISTVHAAIEAEAPTGGGYYYVPYIGGTYSTASDACAAWFAAIGSIGYAYHFAPATDMDGGYCSARKVGHDYSTSGTAYYASAICPVPSVNPQNKYVFNRSNGLCERTLSETYELKLTPDTATLEPGKTYSFTATVTKVGGGASSQAVPVSVKVEVDHTSGGHDHGDATRPKGSVSPAIGNTVLPFTFTATAVSGTHTITATCEQCVNKTATATVKVMVEGLWPIAVSPTLYAFIGGEANKPHQNNHYLTNNAFYQLVVLAINYNFLYPNVPVLHLNDASLRWGGLFDKDGDWETPHAGHRRGTVIDIRANSASGNIPERLFTKFEELADATQRNLAGKVVSANAELHCSAGRDPEVDNCVGDSNRHYHVILLGVDQ